MAWKFDRQVSVGNIISILVTAGGLFAGYMTLVGSVTSSAEAVKSIPGIQERLTKVEINQVNGKNDRLDFQQRTETTLDKLAAQSDRQTSQSAAILAQLSGIVARMDEADRNAARHP